MNLQRLLPFQKSLYRRIYPPPVHPLTSIPKLKHCHRHLLTWAKLSEQEQPFISITSAGKGNLSPTSISLSRLLSHIGGTRSLGQGLQVQSLIIKHGLFGDTVLCNHLINLYAKCGTFGYARKLLDECPEPDFVSYSALISGYAQNGMSREALLAFREMRDSSIMFNEFALSSMLRACGMREDLGCGKQVHGIVFVTGFQSDAFVANSLVVMYAKCQKFEDSMRTFDGITDKNVVTWNALFSCYVQADFCEEAVHLFREMVSGGTKPDDFGLSITMKACASIGGICLGRKTHVYTVKLGYEANQFVSTALIDMYAKMGDLEDAIVVFENIVEPDTVTWNAMIAGCVLHEDHQLALELYDRMKSLGVNPNFFTLSSVLKACTETGHQEQGRQLHALLIKMDMKRDLFVGVGLVDMYSKCDSMEDALMVFKTIPKKDVIAWNALISGFSQSGENEQSLALFIAMYKEGVRVNQTTLSTVLKSTAGLQDVNICRQVHVLCLKTGLLSNDFVVNSLVDSYGKCSHPEEAGKIFGECGVEDQVSFTSMITAYCQCGQGEEALKLFKKMQGMGLGPDQFVCSSVLNACANLSAYEQGKQVHVHALKNGYMSNIFTGNSLVNMYAKCGSLEEATQVFSRINERGIVSWSAMIGGLAQHGHGREALELFDRMLGEGILPNHVTLVSVLYACSQAGFVDEAKCHFGTMEHRFGTKPTQEHYACMIDLLGRAGKLVEAMELVNAMPFEANASVWGSLLGAARIHKNVELGQRAAGKLFILEPDKSGAHILLANIYASAGMWENVSEMRRLMRESKVKKEPGMSWIEVKGMAYTFLVGDRCHPRSKEIYKKLDELKDRMKKAGYVPMVEIDLHDVERSEKERLLLHHSEKLAVAFGLIATPGEAPIRVKKNLRICIDCHTAFKFICKLESREIIVRDINRYHRFRDGSCSCGDYW